MIKNTPGIGTILKDPGNKTSVDFYGAEAKNKSKNRCKMKKVGYFAVLSVLMGCRFHILGGEPRNPDIDSGKVAYIQFYGDNYSRLLSDSSQVQYVISEIEKAESEFIKFGSSQRFVLLDKNKEVIEEGSYRGTRIKIQGVVYKMKGEDE